MIFAESRGNPVHAAKKSHKICRAIPILSMNHQIRHERKGKKKNEEPENSSHGICASSIGRGKQAGAHAALSP